MKNLISIILILFCQLYALAQDKNVAKVAEYIKDKKDSKAKDLLDKLDKKTEYQSDVSFWFVRTAYYRNIAIENPNKTEELAEARKSFEKLEELDKIDPQKLYSKYIPSLKKDLFEGKNKIEVKPSNNSQSNSNNQTDVNEKTVTLTVIGEGKTKDAAKYNAFRNAIEKSFGTFVSSNTQLIQDELVKDEIVSLSNGNIENFEILSETKMPDGSYTSVVKVTVSVGKLTAFCESKGIAVEFKGGLFAANIKLQELNKKNEVKVIENLFEILKKIASKSFDYTVNVMEPKRDSYNDNDWIVDFSVNANANKNLGNFKEILLSTIDNICLGQQDVSAYSKQNIKTYNIIINGKTYYFRNSFSIVYLVTIFARTIPLSSSNFTVTDGFNKYDFSTKKGNECSYDGISGKFAYVGIWDKNNNSIYNVNDFLKSIDKSNINNNNVQFYSYDSKFDIPSINLDNLVGSMFTYYFSKHYTVDQLSEIKGFKVTPN